MPIPSDALDRFVGQYTKKTTRDTYRLVAGWFLACLAERGELAPALAAFREKHCQVAYASERLYLTVVEVFLAWCKKEGLIDSHPEIEASDRDRDKPNPKFALSRESVQTLVASIQKDDSICGKRDLAIVLLMLFTGLRKISVSTLDTQDLQESGGRHLLYYLGKGHRKKHKFVVPPKTVLDAMAAYLKATGRNWESRGPVFLTTTGRARRLELHGVTAAVRKRLEDAGIAQKGITPHSLRHTAASFAYAATKDIKRVQELLGHEHSTTTDIYLHSINRMEDPVEDAIDYGLGDLKKGKRNG